MRWRWALLALLARRAAATARLAPIFTDDTVDTPTQRELPAGGRFVGLNVVQTQSWSGSWTDSAYTASVSTRLLPGFLRYPGGTVGNYWDWKTGWFLTDVNWTASNVAWYANIEKRPSTLSDFAIGVRATGATPVLSLNMLTSNLSYQLAGLHAAAALGLNVSVVELANEMYESADDVVARFPTAADYAEEANAWARAVRSAFPRATVAVVGSYSEHYGSDARRKT